MGRLLPTLHIGKVPALIIHLVSCILYDWLTAGSAYNKAKKSNLNQTSANFDEINITILNFGKVLNNINRSTVKTINRLMEGCIPAFLPPPSEFAIDYFSYNKICFSLFL